jgi:hypothetical protein
LVYIIETRVYPFNLEPEGLKCHIRRMWEDFLKDKPLFGKLKPSCLAKSDFKLAKGEVCLG